MNVRIWIGAAAGVLFAAGSAAAQTDRDFADSPHWYVALGVGYHLPGTVDSHSTLPAPDGHPYDWRWQTANGGALVGSIGYRFTPHLRVELESGAYDSDLVSVHAPGGNDGGLSASRPGEPFGLCAATSILPKCVRPSGWTYMWTGFTNLIYDIMPERSVQPFLGMGVGLAHFEWAAHSRTDEFSGVPGPISISNPAVQTLKNAGTLFQPSQLAIQFLGGVSYRLARDFRLDFTYYHYLTPGNLRWNPVNSTPGLAVGAGLRPGDFLGKFQDDSVIVSLRYAF